MTSTPNNNDNNSKEENESFLTQSFDKAESDNWKKDAKKSKQKRKMKKGLFITFISLCVVIAMVVTSLFVLGFLGKGKLLNKDVNIDSNNEDAIIYGDSTILYNGVLYEYNQDVTGMLFMGIDREELTENGSYGTNGQADTIMLVTVDTKTGKTFITAIPRDTVTGIDIYSTGGEFIKTEEKQICLAYAYGDGRELSCENTVKAVCELLLGMPVNTYLSADYSLIEKLTNVFGEFSVVPNESFEATKPHYSKVYKFEKDVPNKLTSDNVLAFLKYRGNNADSSYLRMERQMNFLSGLVEATINKTKTDISFPVSLFNMFAKETVSNLSPNKITFITSSVFSNRNNVELEFRKLEGEQIIGEEGLAEFHPDETKLFELVLELFYKPVTD